MGTITRRARRLASSGFVLKPVPYYTESHAVGAAGASLTGRRQTSRSCKGAPRPPCVSVTKDETHEGAPVMKKILLLIATAAGVLAIQKKLKDQQAEQDLWAEATDKV
jgi:hypothetical protein